MTTDPKRNGSENWNWVHEKDYLDKLGTGKWSRNVLSPRKWLLLQYINTIGYRSEPWVPKARKYARELLRQKR